MRTPSTRRLLHRSDRKASGRRKLLGGFLLLTVALGLVLLGSVYPVEVSDMRSRFAGPVSSILMALQAPVKPLSELGRRYRDFMAMEGELERLRNENEELKGWQWRALELERQLADLGALTRVVSDLGFDYVTTRVVARSIGAHNRSVLIGAGRGAAVPEGAGVLNQRGLVGTTFEIGPSTSRVLFLDDAKSRLLVSIGRAMVTVEAFGTGAGYLEFRDQGRTFDIAVGDEVTTAGEPGGMPRGLRVGRVVVSSRGMRIEPYVDFDRLEFVSVLVPVVAAGPAQATRLETEGEVSHLTAQLREESAAGPDERADDGAGVVDGFQLKRNGE